MIDIKKVISIILALCTLLSAIPLTALALSWDGSSAGGSTNAVNGSSTGYVIRSTNDDACVVGYRFSAVTSSGAMKVNKVIDVYRKTSNGNNAYSTSAKFSTKYNKKQLIANKDAKLTTTENTTNCYKESSMGFTTALPNPSGVETWQSYEANINKVLSKIGVGSVSNMNYGDKVIIEPLFDVCLAGEYQALTVTEMAYCGRSVLGGSSKGGTSNGTSKTWGFIANYTNRVWPNKLYTPDGQGLWTGVSAIGSSSKETFNNILTKGYGAGIAYNETTNKGYTIKFNGNGNTGGSTASMSMTYGVAKNLTANGFTKTGSAFNGWNTKANGTGTSYSNKQSVKNLTSTAGGTVTLYAQWKPYVLKVYYNANGGSLNSDTYYLSSKNVYKESDNTKYYQTWTYNATKTNGLVNNTTFGMYRTGYTFNQWNTNSSGTGTTFNQDDATLKPSDLKSAISSGDTTLTLYAKWKANSYTIKFDGNGSTGGSTSSMTMTYDVAKNLTANGFTKTGYHFSGWNTKADGSGTSYYNKQSVKNLTATNGGTVTLYAQWDTNSYTIAFNGNGNTGGHTSSMTMKFDVAKNLNANGYTRTGYTFKNWNKNAAGSSTNYSNKQSVKNLTTTNGATVTLYAQWNPNSYTIKFNGNGATSGSTASMSMTYDVAKNLTANGFVKTGYVFSGWNTNSSGTGTSYSNQQSVKNLTSTNGGTVTLYAQWKPITYTIKFDGNKATGGSTASMSMTYNVAKNLTDNGFVRTSYKFTGWNTKADGSSTNYTNKQSVKNLTTTNGATITLYAQWEYDPKLAVNECDVYDGNKGTKTKLYGISTGKVFDDYEYKTGYPTIGNTVWFNIYFPAEAENIKVRQYVKNGGSWVTRDVTLNSTASSQWFPVQFAGKYKTVDANTSYYEVQAKTDWIDANGNVLKSGVTRTFYIPIEPVVYRTQVQARGYEGNVVAYNGTAGSSGKVYTGQHIKIAYKYTAANTWSATEYLRGAMYYHNGSKWVNAYSSNDGFDAAKNKAGLSKSAPITLNSSIGTYTVPKNTQNKLRFNLQTWWASDKDHTIESSWIDIPVIDCDIELKEIRLVEAGTGKILDPQNLEAGQKVKVQYIYKNNTDARVYIEGYADDKSKINDAVYSIDANRTAYLPGYDFTVPNKRTFTLWGGIYLEDMGIYNTEYETNGKNNEKTLICKVNHPLKLTPIAQNAHYRENTYVITSFWVNNTYSDAYSNINSDIKVRFKVYNGSKVIATYTRSYVVVPGNENNLVYFKWKVPTGLNSAKVKIVGEIIDGGVAYNPNSAYYTTTPYVTSTTPDTQFEKKAPSGFSIKSTPATSNQSAEWWQWRCDDNGNFTKVTYGIGISNASGTVEPATGSTAKKDGSTWYMKSGYGLSLDLSCGARYISGKAHATADAFTNPQYAVARLPEFEYSLEVGKCKTLTLSSGNWTFPQNGSYGKIHFTPLWYPNGNYIVSITQSDMWTPAGMITKTMNANTIKITDSAYDDWYISR